MRSRDELRRDFAASGAADYLPWLKQQPEGNPAGDSRQPSRGLGDTVARITRTVGIKPCSGCKRRQQKLNQLFPYR